MGTDTYFHWLTSQTPTRWWNDSADPDDVKFGLDHQATGTTTNPVLVYASLKSKPEHWARRLREGRGGGDAPSRAEHCLKTVVTPTAAEFRNEYEKTRGRSGYVCAQVDPSQAANRDAMTAMALRFHQWAPNIAVKLPATAAGLDALEECAAQGITVAATVSFTVAQVIAVAERHRRGRERARQSGKTPGQCFAVIMIGRLDDYLRDVARDQQARLTDADLSQAGLAITKRAYAIYRKQNYEARLMVAALRGTHHMEQLAGGDLIMSVHPVYQKMLLQPEIQRRTQIEEPIADQVIRRLETVREFVRAYEPHGLTAEEFLTLGVTQRTLSQFFFAGWSLLGTLTFPAVAR